jgi:hypothetical protein
LRALFSPPILFWSHSRTASGPDFFFLAHGFRSPTPISAAVKRSLWIPSESPTECAGQRFSVPVRVSLISFCCCCGVILRSPFMIFLTPRSSDRTRSLFQDFFLLVSSGLVQDAPSRPPASGSFFSSRCIASFFYSFLVRQVCALRDLRFPLLLAVIRAPVLVGFRVSVLATGAGFWPRPGLAPAPEVPALWVTRYGFFIFSPIALGTCCLFSI